MSHRADSLATDAHRLNTNFQPQKDAKGAEMFHHEIHEPHKRWGRTAGASVGRARCPYRAA